MMVELKILLNSFWTMFGVFLFFLFISPCSQCSQSWFFHRHSFSNLQSVVRVFALSWSSTFHFIGNNKNIQSSIIKTPHCWCLCAFQFPKDIRHSMDHEKSVRVTWGGQSRAIYHEHTCTWNTGDQRNYTVIRVIRWIVLKYVYTCSFFCCAWFAFFRECLRSLPLFCVAALKFGPLCF